MVYHPKPSHDLLVVVGCTENQTFLYVLYKIAGRINKIFHRQHLCGLDHHSPFADDRRLHRLQAKQVVDHQSEQPWFAGLLHRQHLVDWTITVPLQMIGHHILGFVRPSPH